MPCHGAALILPLDLEAMDRLAGIFHHRVALDVDAAEFLVDLNVDDVDTEARSGAGHVHFRVSRDSASVNVVLPAISAIDSGGKSPTLELAGRQ